MRSWSAIPVEKFPALTTFLISLTTDTSINDSVQSVTLVGCFITFFSLNLFMHLSNFLPSRASVFLLPLDIRSAFKSPSMMIFFLVVVIFSSWTSSSSKNVLCVGGLYMIATRILCEWSFTSTHIDSISLAPVIYITFSFTSNCSY